MVDWQSPATIAANGAAFGKFMHVLLGVYIWEWAISTPFDWQYISLQKKFRWPLIFYFLNRYALLFAMVGIAIALNVTTEVDCQMLYTFNQCMGNAAIGLASINLSLRTIAVWSQKLYIVVPLVLIIMGHWSLLLHGVLLKAAWIPEMGGCVITSTDNKLLAATFIYTMAFDFVVLCLSAWKLAFQREGVKSRLVTLIFGDQLIYFWISFLANLVATIFMLLNLNPVMSIIANVPAAIASTIVACRAVRRLTNFTNQGPERFTSSTAHTSSLGFRTGPMSRSYNHTTSIKKPQLETDAVVVQMETFTHEHSDPSFVGYDASGKISRGDSFDPEAQEISNEFKKAY